MKPRSTTAMNVDRLSSAQRALLAKRLNVLRDETESAGGISRCSRDNPAPLSFAQQRLWFLDQLEPGSPLYNTWQVVRLRGELDIAALHKSFTQIVRRHEALRTTFATVEGNPVQIIAEPQQAKLSFTDLSHLPGQKREVAAEKLLREEIRRPFDLSRDLMLRTAVIRLGEREHLLLITMHHIASDAWSMGILFRELAAFYLANLKNEAPRLPELEIQYADFAAWQTEPAQQRDLQPQMDYWKRQLGKNAPVLELTTDRPRPERPTFAGDVETIELPEGLTEQLKALSRQEGATLFMTLLAAFKALLHRYTAQDEILIGSPIAGRNQIETEPLIGFFVNTLVLRSDVSGNPLFRELLRRVRETALEAFANQDVPFEKLVAELQPERNLNLNPLFQAAFALQSAPMNFVKLSGLEMSPVPMHSGSAKFDLSLDITEAGSGLRAVLEYSTDLFKRETIQRMLGHYRMLLQSIAAAPDTRIGHLVMLSKAERKQLLVDWNDTATDYPRDKCVHDLFEEQARCTPEAIAVSFANKKVSYIELNARANQLAHRLRKLKISPDTLVGVCVDRSVEMVVAMLAVLKAGGAYLPLDPTYPKERLAFMLEDAGAPVLLTQENLRHLFSTNATAVPASQPEIICLDSDWGVIARESDKNPANVSAPENLAYVIYTSGSTGVPKGVAVPHRGIVRLVCYTDYIDLTPADRVAQVSNASFDAATFEIWGALLNGGQLIGITKDVALSPKDFAAELREQKISALFLTTALFNQAASEAPGAFETVKNVLFGGEACDPKWIRSVLNNKPPQRLLHVYGPTENTTFSTWFLVDSVPTGASTVPIGSPIANSAIYLLDGYLNPVPIGVPGEVYVCGDGLARGYLNRPELTLQKFVPNPFAHNRGEVLYRTGDSARFLPDGSVEFLGRLDDQVKIRGFRVELGEIESLLNQHPAIRECVIAAPKNSVSNKLVAYYAPSAQSAPTVTDLRRWLEDKLPDYMLPAMFVALDALPLTPNGKIDRRALPAPDLTRPEFEKKYVAASDEIEEQLVEIWQNVLGVQPIGVKDKFFELGGHSLLAVRLLARVEKKFGKKLPVATIFHAQTVSQIAAILRNDIQPASTSSLVEIQSKGTKPPLFFIHGAGGGMFWGYSNLARELGTDQPVYALKSRGMDGLDEFGTIEELAAHYVNEVRTFQPRGPYYLGGYCFGGNVAFEMARQFYELGEKVALLGLINCAPPNSTYTCVQWSPSVALKFVANILYWSTHYLRERPIEALKLFRTKAWLARKKFSELRHLSGKPLKLNLGDVVDLSRYSEERQKLWAAHINALFAYHPRPYPGNVVLFRNRGHSFFCSFARDNGWGELVLGEVKIVTVSGAHESVLQEPHVRGLAKEFSTLLNSAQYRVSSVAAPERSRAISSAANGEQDLPISDRSGTPESLHPGQPRSPEMRCVHELFEAQTARTPSALAVKFQHAELNFDELNRRGNILARQLRQLGAGADVPVAISLERSLEMAVSVLAVLKAGAAYVPLDPAYPKERLGLMLQLSNAPILITQKAIADAFPKQTARILCVDEFFEQHFASEWEENPAGASNCENLAYVIFTSGSTGTPKGVAMPHRPLANLIRWQSQNTTVLDGGRTLQFASLSFDVSFQELFCSWCAGGSVLLVSEEQRRDPSRLWRSIRDEKIERIFLPFVALQQLAEVASLERELPQTLREVITAGEQLQISPKIVSLFERLPHCKLVNQYGPSETHVVSAYELSGAPKSWPSLPPIGKAISNTQLHVLDAKFQPVQKGKSGELFIGGDCLARGYLHRDDLTTERFVKNPFGDGRLYKTGDIVREDQNGNFEFLGRTDQQMKIRGYRIEPGEVEALIGRAPGVRECAAVACDDGSQKRLVAYVVPQNGKLSAAELRRFAEKEAPQYMVPSAFVFLEALPLTPSGKINRRALPAPDFSRTRLDSIYTAPRNSSEEMLAQIWQQVLNVPQIGIRDNFFDLGGNSLIAARLFAEIERRTGKHLPLLTLVQSPTIEQLAGALDKVETNGTRSSLVPIKPNGSHPPLFLVHGAGSGIMWGYANLAEHLSENFSIYGIESRGLAGLEEFTTIERMAAEYISDLRAFQPSGPYFLGGYCFGGNVAFEMARQLKAAGEEIALLLLIDSEPNTFYGHVNWLRPAFTLKFLRNLVFRFDDFAKLGPKERRGILQRKFIATKRKLARRLGRTAPAEFEFDLEDVVPVSQTPELELKLWRIHLRALKSYRHGAYDGRAVLFRTRSQPIVCSFAHDHCWSELIREGVDVKLIPGSHERIFIAPHVEALAREIEECFRKASKPFARNTHDTKKIQQTA